MKLFKTYKNSLLLVTTFLLFMVGTFAWTETFRQGGLRFSFNPSAVVTKTAAYTTTVSDSRWIKGKS